MRKSVLILIFAVMAAEAKIEIDREKAGVNLIVTSFATSVTSALALGFMPPRQGRYVSTASISISIPLAVAGVIVKVKK